MQTTTKKRRTSLAAANYFGLSPKEYFNLAKFSSKAEAELGLKTTAIAKGSFGSGCLMKLASAHHNYEVRLSAGRVLLGTVTSDGKRVRLFEAGTHTELMSRRSRCHAG